MKKLVKEVFDTRDALMPPSGSTSYMKLFEEAWEQYGQTTVPQQITLFETDNGETEKVESLSRFPSKEKGVNPPKVNPTVAPGSVEDASWDGRVGEPGKTQRQASALVKEASEGLDELDRCILASDKQIVTIPQHPLSDQRVNCTEAFKRGAVPGFEAGPKKRPKIEDHSAASKTEDIDDKQTKGDEGKESSALLPKDDPAIEEQIPEQLQGDDSFQVIEVYLVGDQSAIEKIVAPKGTTCSQLIGAESRLQNKKSIQITDAVGQIIPETQQIEHGSILRCVTTQDKTEEKPDLRHDKRDILLWQQKGWTASDEMEFYRLKVDEMAKGSTYQGLILMDSPATATDFSFWVLQIAESLQPNNVEKTASFVLWNQHWVPIGIAHNEEGMEITTTPEAVGLFQRWAQQAWQNEANDIQWKTIPCAHAFQNDCGFQTIAWIQAYVQNTAMKFVNGFEASQQRAAFHRHLEETSLAQEFVWCPLTLGGMMNPDEKLAQLLQDHGVAKTRCTECAANLMQSLGKSVIQQVLTSAKPWADLKARASMVRPPIRSVLADELQATIDRRIKEGGTIGRKNNKAKGRPKTNESFKLSADQIHIPKAVFCQADGIELEHIAASSIGSVSQGVVVANIDEALPYFQLQKPITTEGIALLILDFEDKRIPEQRELIKVPAICLETQEPILVQVAMLQIGSKQVGRNVPSQCLQIQEVANRVVRAMVYKDQYPGEWQDFLKHPVRQIMQNPIFAQHQQEILDVWDRQFLSIRMTKTPQAECAVFVVCIRVQSTVADALCQVSGNEGLYCEPRSTTGRQPDDAYQVIWLPKKTFAEAQLAVRSSEVRTTLARSGDRYGLRVDNDKASGVHQLHRPEVLFIQGTELKKFRVGPLPYGSTRQSIANVFRKWEWEARPIGPYAQSTDRAGMIWTVQAAKPPENLVYQLAHGDVLITSETPAGQLQSTPPLTVVASDKTIQCLKQTSKKDEKKDEKKNAPDPWLHYDPWQNSTKPSKEISVAQFAALQAKVEATIDQKLQKVQQDEPMSSASEGRISALEQQVHDLTTSVQTFQSQQTQQNQRMHAQIQAVDQKVEQQQQSIHQLLDSKLEDQMARIEQLFAKRARME